ncbi:glycosyltransferase family 2 protein [Roseibium sediminis]|uniref:glycosyltransferase family 2 protein n=1 Tax=Roseibium sediminis TaxID=1775174 RepID=UPI00137617DA|nr:glycosyltransferase family 2 protein [Roseibium sediminis]
MKTSPLRFGIMVCTAQRPLMLRSCLESLITQDTSDEWQIEICVVENDTQPLSRGTIDELNQTSPFPIRYEMEPRRGIPFARNKTLDMAKAQNYDWILLIDDDEVARKDWLAKHVQTAQSFNADISYGQIKRTYEQPLPIWAPQETPLDKNAGVQLSRASTNNVLFKSALLHPPANLRFNNALTYGYEDLDFFENAAQLGFKIVWAPDAIVEEYVPASRVASKRIIDFAKSCAAAHVQVGILRKGYWKVFPKFFFKGLRRVLSATVLAAVAYVPALFGSATFVNLYYRSRMRLARGIGNLLGLFGRPPSYYSTIDGH